jgi:GNAT superfamily N-acetyltransferase
LGFLTGGRKLIEVVNRNKKLAELLSSKTSCIYFSCVLENSMKGQVWVDNLENPSFAVVWNEFQQGFQLMGKPLRESEYKSLRLFIENDLFHMLRDKNINYFECGFDSEELTGMLFDIFEERKIDSEQQKIFRLQRIINPEEGSIKVNGGFDTIAIDESFFKAGYENIEYVTHEIDASWKSREDYLKRGYGYAAVIDNCIVSRVLVTCCYGSNDNIGADTMDKYRRMGLSSKLVYMTLLEARKRGRECVWDCMEENVASEKTALKVGFEQERTYTVCWFNIT